jgi:hypothetical protein
MLEASKMCWYESRSVRAASHSGRVAVRIGHSITKREERQIPHRTVPSDYTCSAICPANRDAMRDYYRSLFTSLVDDDDGVTLSASPLDLSPSFFHDVHVSGRATPDRDWVTRHAGISERLYRLRCSQRIVRSLLPLPAASPPRRDVSAVQNARRPPSSVQLDLFRSHGLADVTFR